MAEITEIDLSEFGLDGPGDAPSSPAANPPAVLSSGGISDDVLREIGIETPSTTTNGQATLGAMPSQQADLPFDFDMPGPVSPPDLPAEASIPSSYTPVPVAKPESSGARAGLYSPPSTGFGILEQLLLEVSRLNLEVQGLRQTLSNPGASGPSSLPRTQGAQTTASGGPTAERGAESLTVDPAPRPRRRGRPPKKEDEEIQIEM